MRLLAAIIAAMLVRHAPCRVDGFVEKHRENMVETVFCAYDKSRPGVVLETPSGPNHDTWIGGIMADAIVTKKNIERFWAKVGKRGPDECWEWMAGRNQQGYGLARRGGRQMLSHRIAWKLERGEIPPGLCICHHCDNRICCNPAHLFLGTKAENNADRARKNRGCRLRGPSNGRAKLTEEQATQIISLLADGVSQISVARRFGVSKSMIWFIASGKNWTHLPRNKPIPMPGKGSQGWRQEGKNPCRCDLDRDGQTSILDWLIFSGWYFDGDARADWDGDGEIRRKDAVDFIDEWKVGCP